MAQANGNGRDGSLNGAMDVLRERMVTEQLVARGVRAPRVLEAMRRVERHRFMPAAELPRAYGDHPVAIGFEQTLSQPYIVARMTEVLALRGDECVLEVGTGSGYQTAVLAELVREVCTVERVPELAREARARLASLGYANVYFRMGDGRLGWTERAPYDAVLVAAATDRVPEPLMEQLGESGRLVIPLGPPHEQQLELYVREGTSFRVEHLGLVRFVPLV